MSKKNNVTEKFLKEALYECFYEYTDIDLCIRKLNQYKSEIKDIEEIEQVYKVIHNLRGLLIAKNVNESIIKALQ